MSVKSCVAVSACRPANQPAGRSAGRPTSRPAVERTWKWTALALGLCLGLAAFSPSFGDQAAAEPTLATLPQEKIPMQHAQGEFDVKMLPQPLAGPVDDANLGRMNLEKELRGDLEAKGFGQMLASNIDAQGSGAYVAIERITGKLAGREGSFVLVHRGIMNQGIPDLAVTIVPGSGTGELAGIAGTFKIRFEGKKHFYELDYTLPERP